MTSLEGAPLTSSVPAEERRATEEEEELEEKKKIGWRRCRKNVDHFRSGRGGSRRENRRSRSWRKSRRIREEDKEEEQKKARRSGGAGPVRGSGRRSRAGWKTDVVMARSEDWGGRGERAGVAGAP